MHFMCSKHPIRITSKHSMSKCQITPKATKLTIKISTFLPVMLISFQLHLPKHKQRFHLTHERFITIANDMRIYFSPNSREESIEIPRKLCVCVASHIVASTEIMRKTDWKSNDEHTERRKKW